MTKPLKTLVATAAISLAVAGAASAQDALQWQGFYAGAQVNSISPDLEGAPVGFGSGQSIGVFGGYNHALADNFVVGGELSFNGSSSHTIVPGTDLSLDNLMTVRARGGYAVGSALFYGSVGYATTDASITGVPFTLDASGTIFGLGVEAMLTETLSARIEYNRANMDLSGGGVPPGLEVNADAVTMGIAYHF
ncbi:outer membrane beta-barrel protein [Roseobacter sp. HKCCD9010]|uniref:porin family protein n=1 Tax=unclassified Roseobacter TaxID=196798 RepID=UPI001491AB0B|nr:MULTISPECIES: porin family protein [unclassified Roseobacter]MBF9051339.1 outer membrane beta-barrel protein [Rhodobacterales bacterium HKCCD4356]NNV13386.1 outer membrane beta-barrel protein [Roseobacter sp. HKCCD7357]NNV17637.1 outer membrane beta-barrel protein [Roseobacter sp. HKCCD8768]NNV27243.1 outer membrane beta-barrel protein [Roseobacter sp. HKCCD8192]NNV31363.1 outer membrane beta-barrel protein [Roseobacter sp. HKCCD9061]